MTRRKPTPTPVTAPGGIVRHGAAIYDEAPHDPYEARGKYREPARCGDCGAIFHGGRWSWGEAAQGSRDVLCPACHRIRDKLPAGILTLEGAFVDAHRDELTRLAFNEETREKAGHPLHRIMALDEGPERLGVATTDIHLARRIGEAVRHAYQGELELAYGKHEYSLRARWRR
jgi:hypothetical protein